MKNATKKYHLRSKLLGKKRRLSIFFLCFLLSMNLMAQKGSISGTVSDKMGALPGANVYIEGTTTGTSTDINGNYSLDIAPGTYTIVGSFVGYSEKSETVTVSDGDNITLDFTLASSILEEVLVIGSRAEPRSQMETAVPIDVISPKEIINSPQVEISQILQYIAPSFHSTPQTIADGTDHIDPATLRGLGPDQVLVLINGKRRHNSSLVNVNGTVGRGTVGTDLNAIPTAAIERIEILRDGAAAQYGSDAIAGVINIVLKDDADLASVSAQYGITQEGDGEKKQLNVNYGFDIAQKGFVNVTGSFTQRGSTNRSGDYTGTIFGESLVIDGEVYSDENPEQVAAFYAQTPFDGRKVMEIGNSANSNGGIFANAAFPIAENAEIYANGGFNFRKGKARGFYRFPSQEERVVYEIHPLGFSPEIHSDIVDHSFTAGVKGEKDGWKLDFSNTRGANSFDFTVKNSNNASMGTSSPLSAEAGGFRYMQNTANIDLAKKLDPGIPLNVAFGGEFRVENYKISAGEEASYIDGGDTTSQGSPKTAGIQVFPGFQPDNELDEYRTNTAFYTDLEGDLTENFLLGLAARYEFYSDFGSNVSWKASARYIFADRVTVRAAYSTGFRAPSLHQIYFNNISTQFVPIGNQLEPIQVGTFNNESTVAKSFGIESLNPETSQNVSAGLTARILDNLSFTFDAYLVNIKDRIVLSGRFSASDTDGQDDPTEYALVLQSLGVGAAQFFTNAVDTRTTGLDAVINYIADIGPGDLNLTAALNLTQTKVMGDIKTSDLLQGNEDLLFNREEISRLEVAQPRSKLVLSARYEMPKFSFGLRTTQFGEVAFLHPSDGNPDNWVENTLTGQVETRDQSFTPKWVTDLDITWKVTKNLRWTIGSNNIFNVYPDEHTHSANISSGRFVYSRRVSQFGVNGAFYYTKIALQF